MPLLDIAKQAIAKHGDIDAAVEYVMAHVRRNPDMLAECIRPACQHAVWIARGASTRATKQGASARTGAGLAAASAIVGDSILDSWCVGSKRLGDLTRDDLLAEAEQEREQSKARAKCAAFYDALAGMVKGSKTLRQSVKADAVEALWKGVTPTRQKRKTKQPASGAVGV